VGLYSDYIDNVMGIEIKVQFFNVNGYRPLTYGIWVNNIWVGYAPCWCRAVKAAQWLVLILEAE
jgi:hypothetical protein